MNWKSKKVILIKVLSTRGNIKYKHPRWRTTYLNCSKDSVILINLITIYSYKIYNRNARLKQIHPPNDSAFGAQQIFQQININLVAIAPNNPKKATKVRPKAKARASQKLLLPALKHQPTNKPNDPP